MENKPYVCFLPKGIQQNVKFVNPLSVQLISAVFEQAVVHKLMHGLT